MRNSKNSLKPPAPLGLMLGCNGPRRQSRIASRNVSVSGLMM